eukprot:4777742-Prymnesium_polylepis.1
MAVLPRGRLPDVRHRDRALVELIVVVDEMEVLAVESVHARLRRLVRVKDLAPRLVDRVPLLLLRLAGQQIARRGHKEHRLLRIVARREKLDARALDIEDLDEARVQPALAAVLGELAERHRLRLADLGALLVPNLAKQLGDREALVRRLDVEDGVQAVLVQREGGLHGAEPAVGDHDATGGEEGLDEAQRERDRLLVAVAVLGVLHRSRALEDLAADHDPTLAVADRVHLGAL